MNKIITRVKENDKFVLQDGHCDFVKKKATEDGFCILIKSANVNIFITDREFDKARLEREGI